MERDGQTSTAMPMCREEDLPYFFHQLEEYFATVIHKPFYIALADEEAVQYLGLDPREYEVEEQVDLKDYLYDGEAMRLSLIHIYPSPGVPWSMWRSTILPTGEMTAAVPQSPHSAKFSSSASLTGL